MAESCTNLGKDLNTTFLPAQLLRKTDNKANSTLNHKCTFTLIQTIFKKQLAMPSSPLTPLKSSLRATNSTNPTLQPFVSLIEHPFPKESQSSLHKAQSSALKMSKRAQLPRECQNPSLSCSAATNSSTNSNMKISN